MNSQHDGDDGDGKPTLARLRLLPPPQQDPARAARTLRRARGGFLQYARGDGSAFWQRVGRLYFTAEPVLAASLAVIYLGWAVDTLTQLWR